MIEVKSIHEGSTERITNVRKFENVLYITLKTGSSVSLP